jgi:hypothetical protein
MVSPNIIKMIKSRGVRLWDMEHAWENVCIQTFVRKLEGKSLLGRPTRRWEDDIKMDPQETEYETLDWVFSPVTGSAGVLL